jgi:hypothetical protein
VVSEPTPTRTLRTTRDRGAILPLVLVMAVVVSLVIVTLANYVTTNLTYGHIVEERADRLAAADGGLRYAVERLQNSAYAGCLTNLGDTGYTIDFPATVNGSDVDVTCSKGSSDIGDIKAWALIITGELASSDPDTWMMRSQGGSTKLLGGPVWVTDPSTDVNDLQSPVEVEDGDIWFYRADCSNPNLTVDPSQLSFTPAFRGTICVEKQWYELFDTPEIGWFPWPVNTAKTNQAPTMSGECTVFHPGRYTVAPTLGANTYFRSGNYYFEGVTLTITNAAVTAGWADFDGNGDQQFIPNYKCDDAIQTDKESGSLPGATFYMGSSSRIVIDTNGTLEIMRREQGDDFVSIHALSGVHPSGKWFQSTIGSTQNMIETQSGLNADLAIHGLVWAPYSALEFGNVTNVANGQLLGGAALAKVVLQASASASNFLIRVETSPADFQLRLSATATKNGRSTTMTAVVDVDDQGTTAVNSLRVIE